MDAKTLLIEARTFSIGLAKQIAERANGHYDGGDVGSFAGTASSLVMQTTIVSMMVTKFHPGSKEGEAALREFYESATKDAIDRWHKSDLKERGFGPGGRG